MTVPQFPVLEFPTMLRGPTGTVRRQVSAQGRAWAREYLETGEFTQPRRMLPVPPGEPLVMDAAAELEFMCRPATWRVHLFIEVFMDFNENVPEAQYPRAREALDSFCLSTPWGALYHAATQSPSRSAERMVRQLTALLNCWDILQGPRYAHWAFNTHQTLDGLMEYLYRPMLEVWIPRGPSSVREHLLLTVERMSRATRQECLEAVLRMIPVVLRGNVHLQNREVLGDPDFLRERLASLRPEDFDDLSSADRSAVNRRLSLWDRALERR